MLDFNPDAQGKHLHDLRGIYPEDQELQEDVMCCIRNGDGPDVLLCGGIHGDEYEPQAVLRQLIDDLDPSDVVGRLIIVPTINPPASQRGSRVSPVYGQNMNRVFPGDSSGTATERLAAFLHDKLFPLVDLLVDVHSGGRDYRVVPMIFGFTSEACKIDTLELDRIMDSWGYPIIQYVNGIPSTSAGSSPLAGVTSVEIEGGGGGAMTAAELLVMREGILRGLHSFGVLAGGPEPADTATVRVDVGPANNHTAPRDGLLEHTVELGKHATEGDLLAVLHPIAGSKADIIEVRASSPGPVLRQRAHAFVSKGELICNTGTLRA